MNWFKVSLWVEPPHAARWKWRAMFVMSLLAKRRSEKRCFNSMDLTTGCGVVNVSTAWGTYDVVIRNLLLVVRHCILLYNA